MSSSITFGDLVGEVHHDPDAVKDFLTWWFDEDDLVNITFIKEEGKKKVFTHGGTRDEMIETLSGSEFKTEFLDKAAFNTYFTTSASNKVFIEDDKNRPSKKDCEKLRGVWADVDVKTGVFGSEDAVRGWIDGMDVKPGAIVWTGSGGAHLYWQVDGLDKIPVSDVGKRWWGYLDSVTPEGVVIDRLIDVETRILRVPGTTRFPKEKEMIGRKPVTLELTGENPIELGMFKKLTEEGLKNYNERTKHTTGVVQEYNDVTIEMPRDKRLGFWGRMAVLSKIEELVPRYFTWDEILEDAGWEFYRTASEGRREWARPGKFAKAGVTDWEESPHVMSLFSWSEETGLAELYEADVTLTMWRVFLKLRHNDDIESALEELLERGTNK